MISALIVFLCFCAALFVWVWERQANAQVRSAWIVQALTYPVITGMIVAVGAVT